MGGAQSSTADSPAKGGGPKERLVWPDVAKGACIVLVVLWHVIMKHYLQVGWNISLPFPGAWGAAGEVFLPLRMPLFFAISGLFAASALSRPWRVVGRSKVANFFYLYALWVLIHTALLALVPDFDTARATTFLELLANLTISPTNLWYLYALAVYFVLAKLVRRIPAPVVLGAAFLFAAATTAELIPAPGGRLDLFENLLFFLVGVYAKPSIMKVAASASWLRFFAMAVPYVAVIGLVTFLGAETWFGLWPLVSLAAVFLGVTAASLVTRWTALSNGLAALGRRTLPIYVIHMPLLALIHAVLVGPMSAAGPTLQLVMAAVWPVVLTAIVVAICLGLNRILPNAWLFELPGGARSKAGAKGGDHGGKHRSSVSA
ncbi:acyltransferase family protein [Nocardiopsis mangrovi]|uniref:Acyltransferase family protein n=1 Tax=Nocardiopsis mangrovi TaxID=1179818 RepID=A0ABV9DRH5_9ACTN